MTRFASLAAALVLLSGPALAQKAAQAQKPAPAPAAQAAPAAPAPQISPSHLAIARDVALGSGITRTFDAIIPQFYDKIREQAVTRPELKKDLDEVLKSLEPEMELQKQQMINTTARVFATQLSEAELKDVAVFLKSPSGAKYVQMQPVILDTLVRDIQDWTNSLAEYVMIRVRAEMGKRGHHM